MRTIRRAAPAILLFLLVASLPLEAQLSPPAVDRGGNGLGLKLRRLGVTGRVLYVTAHPDDENNAVLVRLSRGLGLRTALLTLTRGEGGQNAIGPEQGQELGIVRTGELMALHRLDGVEQYFGAAYEFGFTFSLEETFDRWGKDATVGEVVRVIRQFQPDLILTMPLESPAHQHHPASAQLAREAFRAAADPARFKDQIAAGLRPWQATRIYEGGVGGGAAEAGDKKRVALDTGAFDPLLGMSARQFGSMARALHLSQVYTALLPDPGKSASDFVLVDAEPRASAPASGLFDGIDTSLRSLLAWARDDKAPSAFLGPGIQALEANLRDANAAFDARAPEKVAPALAAALRSVRKLWDDVAQSQLAEATRETLLGRLDDEEKKVGNALASAEGISLEALLDEPFVAPGESLGLQVSVFNQGTAKAVLDSLDLQGTEGLKAAKTEGETGALDAGGRVRVRYRVEVAPAFPPSRPYWRREGTGDRYTVSPSGENTPWSRPDLVARAQVRLRDLPVGLEAIPVYRYEAAGREKQQELEVRPALSVRVNPPLVVFPAAGRPNPADVRVTVTSEAATGGEAVVRLELPAGFTATPAERPVRLGGRGEEATVLFRVAPPAGGAAFAGAVGARATLAGREYRETFREVAYPHIESRPFLTPAEARVVVVDVKTGRNLVIGYVGGTSGTSDPLPEAIEQIGLPVTRLGPEELAGADLDRFSTIVVGVRAYEVRPDLRRQNARLLRYAEAGGNVLVLNQRGSFNTPSRDPAVLGESPYTPFAAALTIDRITDETSPVTFLDPAHRLLTTPNALGPADFEGWVQERALQLLDTRDARYVQVLAGADPFPKNAGPRKGLLVEAPVGKGTWTYTGLSLFRQLPAGVPGAFRIWANLLSRPRAR